MVEVLLLLLAYALMIDWVMRMDEPVPIARRVVLHLARRRFRGYPRERNAP
jgi:hypothetical protein